MTKVHVASVCMTTICDRKSSFTNENLFDVANRDWTLTLLKKLAMLNTHCNCEGQTDMDILNSNICQDEIPIIDD